MKPLALAFASFALLALSACTKEPGPATQSSSSPSPAADAKSPESQAAHQAIAAGGVLLDVRTPAEYARGHLDGAVNIPVDDLDGRLDEVARLVGKDQPKPVVVYCASGKRSKRASQLLTTAGFKQVTDLGPMSAW